MPEQTLLPKIKLSTMNHQITKVAAFAEIWECTITGQKSLHAIVDFMPGDTISAFTGKEVLNQPNYLTVQLNEQEHIMLAPEFLQYINHSCKPNVFFDTTKMVVTCLHPIEVGEELTFFYPSTEWSMSQGFTCDCKTKECLGSIQGAAHLQPNVLQRYNLSDYIKTKLVQSGTH
jgi:hypothetical protein